MHPVPEESANPNSAQDVPDRTPETNIPKLVHRSCVLAQGSRSPSMVRDMFNTVMAGKRKTVFRSAASVPDDLRVARK